MERLSEQPETLVLAHRGFSEGGVENTVSGLDAALQAGADLVEMDVMQTQDGEFIAMHDAALGRLADRPDEVKDLTLEELTAITVRDQFGNEDRIPSFADYVTHADNIGMPLLVEIKLGGADTDDHVDRLVAELEELGSLENHIYHSLDAASVARLKELRPDLTVGYTMPFAGGGIPNTPADFIVVEEWSASDEMQSAAHDAGLGFMVWTVNEEEAIRDYMRRDSDGIITDHPDVAESARAEMDEESGLTFVLLDALMRFVKVV
ncbi:MAG: glycerophosphodiester phosphodiesterase family protein [Leucobacter sp.]